MSPVHPIDATDYHIAFLTTLQSVFSGWKDGTYHHPPAAASRAAARAVVAQLEGMVLFAKLDNDPAVLGDLWQYTLLLLGVTKALA